MRVAGLVNFISNSDLVPISDVYYVSKWYKLNSMNFIAHSHLAWVASKDGRKLSKRFGNCTKSPEVGMNNMLTKHDEEVKNFIERRVGAP